MVLDRTTLKEQEIRPPPLPVEILDLAETYRKHLLQLNQDINAVAQLRNSVKTNPAKNGLKETLSRLRTERDATEKWVQLSDAGYEQISLKEHDGWLHGYIEDPRPFTRRLGFVGMIVMVSLFSAIVSALSLIFLPYNLAVERLFLGSFTGFLVSLGIFVFYNSKNIDALKAAGFDPRGVYAFLKITPPPHIFEKYEKAKVSELFEEIRVYGPATVFRTYDRTDPIIYGISGGKEYLIAQYDLAKDLETE